MQYVLKSHTQFTACSFGQPASTYPVSCHRSRTDFSRPIGDRIPWENALKINALYSRPKSSSSDLCIYLAVRLPPLFSFRRTLLSKLPRKASIPGGASIDGGPASFEPPNTIAEETAYPTTTTPSPSTIADAAQESPATPAPLDTTEKHRSAAITAVEVQDTGKELASAPFSEQQNNRSPEIVNGTGEQSVLIVANAGGGYQSSAERNIWSVFNPIWRSFPVNKARLPRATDAGVDWAGTLGRPEELGLFLGMKNPVNRT